MNAQEVTADGANAQRCGVSFFITRADGTVEPTVHVPVVQVRAIPAPPVKRKNWLRRLLSWLSLAAIAYGLHHTGHGHALPAATVIVNGGQAIDSNLVSGLGGTVPKYIAWGTGAGTAGVTDTTLFTESADEARTTGTVTRVTTTVTNDTMQVVGSITVLTNPKTITNVGLFDSLTSGGTNNLFEKADFTGQALQVGDSITFTVKDKFA